MLFQNWWLNAENLKRTLHQYIHVKYYFWHDSNDHEVDLLKPTAATFDIYEIKSTSTLTAEHFKGLAYLKEIAPEVVGRKTLIYRGREDQQRSE